MEEFTLELPSGRVAAVAHGDAGGPPVICVHGLSANAGTTAIPAHPMMR